MLDGEACLNEVECLDGEGYTIADIAISCGCEAQAMPDSALASSLRGQHEQQSLKQTRDRARGFEAGSMRQAISRAAIGGRVPGSARRVDGSCAVPLRFEKLGKPLFR